MRRFRILFVVFSLAVLVPAAFLVRRTLENLARERRMRHRAVAERVFDEMERGLSQLLAREEQRSFEHYAAIDPAAPAQQAVIGRFQVDPDGRVRTLTDRRSGRAASEDDAVSRRDAIEGVERRVSEYWRDPDRPHAVPRTVAQLPGTTVALGKNGSGPGTGAKKVASRKGEGKRKHKVTAFDALRSLNVGARKREARQEEPARMVLQAYESALPAKGAPGPTRSRTQAMLDAARSTMEIESFTARLVDPRHLMLYRTVVRKTRAYRQGLLLDVARLGQWLREQSIGDGELADLAQVTLLAQPTGQVAQGITPTLVYQHRFAEPFDDLNARLRLRPLPGVVGTGYVYAMAAILMATGVLGLVALYRMVLVTVSFAERRNNFVAAVSHELKTPLTAIRMYGEMLRDGMVPSEEKRDEYYRHITAESERLSRLINNVLEFSRIAKKAPAATAVTGPITPVLEEVAQLLRPHVEAQGFSLCVETDAGPPPVRFERDALVQVLCNLIDNAVKYTADASERSIVLGCRCNVASVRVFVRDHGPGVPAGQIDKIFEPFHRAENELTRRHKGMGIGLALVRGLAERMGARVVGRNVSGGGFEVEVVFARADHASG